MSECGGLYDYWSPGVRRISMGKDADSAIEAAKKNLSSIYNVALSGCFERSMNHHLDVHVYNRYQTKLRYLP